MGRVFRSLVCLAVVIWTIPKGLQSALIPDVRQVDIHKPFHVGEFENQQAILLGWDGTSIPVQDTLLQIVHAIRSRLQVIMLVDDAVAEECVCQQLDKLRLQRSCVKFARVPFNSIWARDFGPMSVKTAAGDCWLVDSDYLRETGRAEDDCVPQELARLLRLPIRPVPLTVEGGNLLSNGSGLTLTTTLVFESNANEPANVIGQLRESYGADQVVVLEPLFDEGTGHVDMFATFTDSLTVVVGQYDPANDPMNAAILDRNAELLAGITTPHGKLKVERIPMPPRAGHFVLTYTNVIYANGTLLMPDYPGSAPRQRAEAIQLYRRLLPKWSIVTIDCNELISMGGALHCVAMNLARAGKLKRHEHAAPRLIAPPMGHAIIAQDFTFDGSAIEFTPGAISHRAITTGNPLLPRATGTVVFATQDLATPPPPRRLPLFGQPIFEVPGFEKPSLDRPMLPHPSSPSAFAR